MGATACTGRAAIFFRFAAVRVVAVRVLTVCALQMNAAMGVARRLYKPVLRSNVSFMGVILAGAAVGEIFFDGLAERLWKGFNQGKLFQDLPVAQPKKSRD